MSKKVVGTLVVPVSGKATFTAMIALNPGSQAKEMGLEVRLEQEGMNAVAYLDQDCLQGLRLSLESFREAAKDVTDQRPHVTTVYNSQPGAPETAEKAGNLTVGWYGHDDGWGVYLGVPPRKSGSGGGQFYFPEARFEKLLEIIDNTMIFLSAN
jgi:hypothetical protein